MDLETLSRLPADELADWLGQQAKPFEEELVGTDLTDPSPIFVIGPPRSGTTVTYQLLANTGDIGYISNFLARFWKTPVLGALIEKAVGIRENHRPESFESEFGRTSGWHETHEFGYFWDRWFEDLTETNNVPQDELAKIDSGVLRREVAGLEKVVRKPIAFANNTWCTLQASWLAEVFPEALFVVCRRESIYIAQSLYQGRVKRNGSRKDWWSTKPRTYPRLREEPWPDQIVGQVMRILSELEVELNQIEDERIIEVSYQRFCDDPTGLIARIAEKFDAHDIGRPPKGYDSKIQSTNHKQIPEEPFERLADALRRG